MKLCAIFIILLSIISPAFSNNQVTHQLNSNSTIDYVKNPQRTDSFTQLFSKGMFYGRLRLNTFAFDWDKEVNGKTRDHQTLGIGGSILYKSAYLHGW